MDRILTTHVGSLIRTDALTRTLKARERHEAYDAESIGNARRTGDAW